MEEFTSILKKARDDFSRGNYSIAFDSYRKYIALNPSDSEARKEYRGRYCQSVQFQGKEQGLIKRSTNQLKLNMILRDIKSNEDIIEKCEELLRENPFDITVLFKLGKTAKEGGFYETAVDAFSDVIKYIGNKEFILKELALTYYEMKQYVKSKETFEKYNTLNETPDIKKIIDDLPALITSQKYEKATSFTQLEKDQGKSVQLEKERETPKGEEEILKKISELEVIVGDEKEEHKRKLNATIEISELYKRINQYDKAIKARRTGKEFGGGYNIDKALAELMVEKKDYEISQLEVQSRESKDKDLEAKLDQMKKERWELIVEEYDDLVGKAPTDTELHLRLGEGYFYLGKIIKDKKLIEKAIAELQREYTAQTQKDKTNILLGKAFVEMELYTLAEKHFTMLLNEIPKNKESGEKILEAYYELGTILKLKGDIEGAFNAFSEIYRIDIRFRDVAKIVLELNDELKGINMPKP